MVPASVGKTATPEEVTPSSKVKSMEMASHQSLRNHLSSILTPDKIPFTAFGFLSPTTLAQVEISYPIDTGKYGTTAELTRSTRPEARFWKAPISFKYGNFTNATMRFDNVHIPFHTGKGYGSCHVYNCLPRYVGKACSEAG